MPRAARPVRTSAASGLVRRHHPLTWTVVGLHLVFLLAFSLLLPMFRGPDEATHVDMIRRYRVQLGHDRPNVLVPLGADVVAAFDSVGPNVRPRPPQIVENAVPRPDRPSFAELAPPMTPSAATNHMTQHPPLFYAVMSSAASAIGGLTPVGLWSWDREVYFYRMLGILLAVPLPLLAAEAALAMRFSRRGSAVAAAALLLVPQATVIAAGVNNDALVVLGAAVAVAASLWHLRRNSAATAILAATAGTCAALSKATAAPLLAWVVIVIALQWFTERRRRMSTAGLLGSAGITLVGFSWYISNSIRYQDPQPTGLRRLVPPGGNDFVPSRWPFLHTWLDRLSRTFWGMPARRTGVALPWFLPHALSVSAVVLSVAALWDRSRRRATLLLWLLCGSQIALLLRSNWTSHSRSGALPAVQGRYLFALLIPVAVLGVIGARQIRTWWPVALPRPSVLVVGLGVTALGTVLHLLLSISMLDGFWGQPDATTWQRVDAVRAWSPLPSVVTLAVLAAVVLVTVAAVLAVAVEAIREVRGDRAVAHSS